MAQGILSKGITLGYKVGTAPTYTLISDLQEVPELGGAAEKVEVTTLADGAKRYINGIKDYGDLAFKFLYDNSTVTSNYRVLSGLETAGTVAAFEVSLPDGTKFQFSAGVSNKLDGVGVNAPLTFTSTLTLNTDITIVNPNA